MFHEARLPVAPQPVTDPSKPRVRREIHIFIDRAANKLRVEPRGVLEKVAVSEIIDVLGFPLKGGAAEVVLTAEGICARHGWTTIDRWLDEAKDMNVKMAKDVES